MMPGTLPQIRTEDDTEVQPYQSQRQSIYKGKQPKNFSLILVEEKKAKKEKLKKKIFVPFKYGNHGSGVNKETASNTIQQSKELANGSPELANTKKVIPEDKNAEIIKSKKEFNKEKLETPLPPHENLKRTLEPVQEIAENDANVSERDDKPPEESPKKRTVRKIVSKLALDIKEDDNKLQNGFHNHYPNIKPSLTLEIASPMNATEANTEEILDDGNITAKSVNPVQYGIKKPNGFSRGSGKKIFLTPSSSQKTYSIKIANIDDQEVMCSKCNKMINTNDIESHSKKCYYEIRKAGKQSKPLMEDNVAPMFKTSCLLTSLHKCIQKSQNLKKTLSANTIQELCAICKIAENIVEATQENIQIMKKIQDQASTMQKKLGISPDPTTFLYFERVIHLIQVIKIR